jgi:hypothetical protein
MRVYDYSNLASPVQIGQYRTPNSLGTDDQAAGDYTIHNPLLVGNFVYASWYTDGVRVIDVSKPRAPREVAYFVPEAPPGKRSIQLNDLIVDKDGLIYVSDRFGGGLYIFELTGRG